MPAGQHEDELPERKQVVLILRLVLDGNARLLRGELFDSGAMCQARFTDLGGLLEGMSAWLERLRGDCPATPD